MVSTHPNSKCFIWPCICWFDSKQHCWLLKFTSWKVTGFFVSWYWRVNYSVKRFLAGLFLQCHWHELQFITQWHEVTYIRLTEATCIDIILKIGMAMEWYILRHACVTFPLLWVWYDYFLYSDTSFLFLLLKLSVVVMQQFYFMKKLQQCKCKINIKLIITGNFIDNHACSKKLISPSQVCWILFRCISTVYSYADDLLFICLLILSICLYTLISHNIKITDRWHE